MPRPEDVTIDLPRIQLTDADTGQPVLVAEMKGVQILVLMRHRH